MNQILVVYLLPHTSYLSQPCDLGPFDYVVEKDAELLDLSTWTASLMFIEKRKETSPPEAISPPGACPAEPSAASV
jgi:hypothetical protein